MRKKKARKLDKKKEQKNEEGKRKRYPQEKKKKRGGTSWAKARLAGLRFDFYRRVPAQVPGSVEFEMLNLVTACPIPEKAKLCRDKAQAQKCWLLRRKSNYWHIKVRRWKGRFDEKQM